MSQVIKIKRGGISGLSGASTVQGELIIATGSLGNNVDGPFLLAHGDSLGLVAGAVFTGSTVPTITDSELNGILFYDDANSKFVRLDTSGNQSLDIEATGFSGDTDGVSEGSTNLYYTDARVKTKLNTENVHSGSYLGTSTTTNLSEGTNLYYTDARVKTKLNTENVVSGSASDVRTFLNVEDGADVTDATNVETAGALMDSEVTSLDLIKGLTATQISGAFDAASASLAADIPTNNNQLTNGAGYTTNTGTVTSVTVGSGLDISNGSTTPAISLDLTELTVGTGLNTTATGISLDLTEVGFAGGASNKLITNNGDGTVTAESNLGFDGTTLDVDGKLDIDYSTDNTNTAVVEINNNTTTVMSTDHFALKVAGGQANGAPSGQQKSYGGYFTAGNTNGALPDSIALYAQGHEDGAPNSYAAVFSGSAGGVVGINTLEPTVELDVVGDISASNNIVANAFYGDGSSLTNLPSQTDENFTTADHAKLDGIETGADVTDATNVTTALGSISVTAHNDVTSAGSGIIISAAERTKLNGIETGADVTDTANVKTALNANLGTLTIGDSDDTVSVPGNLSVGGTLTTVSSNEVNIGDRIIVLNTADSAGDAGIQVHDTDGAQTGSLLWDTDGNYWKVGVIGGTDYRLVEWDGETAGGGDFIHTDSNGRINAINTTTDGDLLVSDGDGTFTVTNVIDGGTY